MSPFYTHILDTHTRARIFSPIERCHPTQLHAPSDVHFPQGAPQHLRIRSRASFRPRHSRRTQGKVYDSRPRSPVETLTRLSVALDAK